MHLKCGFCRRSHVPELTRTPSSHGGNERAGAHRGKTLRPTKVIILLIAFAAFLAELTDPSGRVGRLNYSNGPVSSQPAFVTDWVRANFNRPLTSSDPIWSGNGGSVEFHAAAAAPRMYSNAAYQFPSVDGNTSQTRRLLGYGALRVRNPAPLHRCTAASVLVARSATPDAAPNGAGSRAEASALIAPQGGPAQAARNGRKK